MTSPRIALRNGNTVALPRSTIAVLSTPVVAIWPLLVWTMFVTVLRGICLPPQYGAPLSYGELQRHIPLLTR